MSPRLLRGIGKPASAARIPSAPVCRHGVPATLVSRETTRQTIPAAFTRRMHECHTPIQAVCRGSHGVRVWLAVSRRLGLDSPSALGSDMPCQALRQSPGRLLWRISAAKEKSDSRRRRARLVACLRPEDVEMLISQRRGRMSDTTSA